jgi:RNA polymerase sigma-70 factor (ECF subfamily)
VLAASVLDPARFADLFERHADGVFAYLARRTGREQAADLTAETFRAAFVQRGRYRPSHATARPWLFGIARNLLRHDLRSRGREERALLRLASRPPEAADDPADELAAREQWAKAAQALPQLAASDREALLLHTWEQLSYAEVATALGIPIGTVRSRIHRARRVLRELIDVDGHEGDDIHPRPCEEASERA